jgi:hypothetical protein
MKWYGLLCFLGVIVAISAVALVSVLAGVRPPEGTIVVGLLLSIRFSSWRFVQTYRRVFLPTELRWFAIARFLAFWICDEFSALIMAFSKHDGSFLKPIATAIVATGVDLAIVAALVYVTVPWATRRFLRLAVA